MELVIITTLLIIIFIMQIILIANQNKNGKLVKELIQQRNRSYQGKDRPRDHNNPNHRQHRKSPQEHRSRQPNHQNQAASAVPASGSVDNVEKSLRDINLKLKNVERDQEAARRKIQENIGSEPSSRRDNRGQRDRHNKNNWKKRNNQNRQPDRNNHSPKPASVKNAQDTIDELPMQPPVLPELTPTDFDTDTTQHGRKFMVKRRLLKEEETSTGLSDHAEAENDRNPSESAFSSDNSSNTVDTADDFNQSNDTEISFGRR